MRTLPPDPTRRQLPDRRAFAEECRADPGDWRVWPRVENASTNPLTLSGLCQQIKRGRYKHFPAGQFDADYRNGVIYVRYVGRSKQQRRAA